MKKTYLLAGTACWLYYILFSVTSRFGLSLSALWLAAGVVFFAAAALSGRVSRRIKLLWRTLLSILLALTIALAAFVAGGMRAYPQEELDVLIILGARVESDGSPSPALRNRLTAAIDYLQAHPDTLAVASGGQGADEPMSEAECIRAELIGAGIDPNRILIEDRSTSTAENLAYSFNILQDTKLSVGVVTNNFHIRRALLLARQAGFENAYGLAADYTGPTLPHYIVRESICLIVEIIRKNLSPAAFFA